MDPKERLEAKERHFLLCVPFQSSAKSVFSLTFGHSTSGLWALERFCNNLEFFFNSDSIPDVSASFVHS